MTAPPKTKISIHNGIACCCSYCYSSRDTYAVLTMPMMLAMVEESAPLVVMVVSVTGVVGTR